MTAKTETPRTDALVKENEDYCTRVEKQIEESAKRLRALDKGHVVGGCAHVSIDTETLRQYFALSRDLERELTQLRDENECLKHERNRIAMDVRSELLPKIARWRELAGRLADAAQHLHDFQNGSPLPKYDKHWSKAMNAVEEAIEAHDALAKLSDGGKG